MAAAKTIVGDFDLPSFEHCVTKQAGIPPDAQLGYQVKRRMQDGKTWQSEPLREGLYNVQAHPDAVVGLEREMATWGLQAGWYALAFHPLNQPSKTIWRWEIPVGGAATQQQQTAPVLYQPPSAPQVYQPQQAPAPHQYPPYAPQQAPQVVQVGPQASASYEPLYDRYGRQVDPRSIQQPAQPPPDPRWDPRYGYQSPPPPVATPGPAPPDPQIAELKSALARLEADRTEDRRRQDEKDRRQEETERDAAAKAREDALLAAIKDVRTDGDAKLDRLLARIDSDRNATPKATVVDQITALATVLAPHFVTMRDSSTRADSEARGREQKLIELMMERRTDPMVEKVLAKFDELHNAAKSQSPSEMFTVMQAASQAMFGGFSMSMKLLEQMSESMPQASPVKEIAGELMGGLKGLLDTFVRSKQIEAQRSAQHTHSATSQPAAPPPTFDIRTRDGMLGYLRSQGAPDDWVTKPWAMILSSLVRREPAQAVGEAMAAQLYGLWKTDSLPEALSALENPADFDKPWGPVMGFMPIEKDEATVAYVKSVLDIAGQAYAAMRNDEPGEGETSEETEEAEGEEPEAEASGANGASGQHADVVPSVPAPVTVAA